MDTLLRTHAAAVGIPDSAIETNIRVNLPDEGADAVLHQPDLNDSTGRLGSPTVWQYKGVSQVHVGSAKALLKGNYLRKRIRDRYAFRLAVADSFPPHKRAALTRTLTNACRKINPESLEPMVVSADDLASWANRYLGLVLRYLYPNLAQHVLHLEAWERNATSVTRTFLQVPGWERAMIRLSEHVDLTKRPASVIRTIHGEAGVGKSRLVYEVLARIPSLKGLVAYCDSEESCVRLAHLFANCQDAPGTFAVLVADECDANTRERLHKLLQGHTQRLRVIAIDNFGRPQEREPELWIEKMDEECLQQVLRANYGHIPQEHRRAYAELARGYPRLAADLCLHHSKIMAEGGNLSTVIPTIAGYLRTRLSEDQHKALDALALVMKVGYDGDLAEQFDTLCALVELPLSPTRQALNQIHDGPGFVARTTRYFYITPAIVAGTSFMSAWRRWVEPNPEAFLSRIPDALLVTFLDRVNLSADQEVRRRCGDYFLDWAQRLRNEDLASSEITARLVALVDTDPAQHLPRLVSLVEEASLDSLRTIIGDSSHGKWGPRRALVWLSERMARLSDYFDASERLLVRLAAAESEPELANNATAIWRQLFRLYLSGTAIPFKDRLPRLRERLGSDDQRVRMLAVQALAEVFDHHSFRMEGHAIVAGRVPPEEWHPRTRAEELDCLRLALGTISHGLESLDRDLSIALVNTLVNHTRGLIQRGLLSEVREMFAHITLTDPQRVMLLESIDEFLVFDSPRFSSKNAHLVENARVWRDLLVGRDLHSRLFAVVGRPRWGATHLQEETWKPALRMLAMELLGSRDDLIAELPTLFSSQSHLAREFGNEIGLNDHEARLLDEVLGQALHAENRGFALGYISGIMTAGQGQLGRLNDWLSAHEQEAPGVVADIALAGGETLEASSRILRLFDQDLLPVSTVYSLGLAMGNEPASEDTFEAILERLARAAHRGKVEARQAGLDMLAIRARGKERVPKLLSRERVRTAAWTLVELAEGDSDFRTHFWGTVLEALGTVDSKRAARLACHALTGDAFVLQDQARSVLVALAKGQPTEVMEALGKAALDEERGWRFFADSFRDLIAAIPGEIVQSWIGRVGVEGARRLARHLPKPYLDGDHAVVPSLTSWVLAEYAEDERLFSEFCAGIHSFEMYSGDIAATHEAEAATARAFQRHGLKRIREWARKEERTALEEARLARQRHEEMDLP